MNSSNGSVSNVQNKIRNKFFVLYKPFPCLVRVKDCQSVAHSFQSHTVFTNVAITCYCLSLTQETLFQPHNIITFLQVKCLQIVKMCV